MYYPPNAQLPPPHCGNPHPPPLDGDSQIGSDLLPPLCAAGTLSSFSSRVEPHSGQAGFSLPRNNISNSLSHFSQEYS